MFISADSITNEALRELSEYELYEAQKLFQKAVKLFPCAKTYHNLGTFYTYEGLRTENGGEKAIPQAFECFKNAIEYEQQAGTVFALGYTYFCMKKYAEAEKCFSRLSRMIDKYNYAVCLYYQNRFSEAKEIFGELMKSAESGNYDKNIEKYIPLMDVYDFFAAAYAFAMIYDNADECKNSYKSVFAKTNTAEYEKIVVAFLCGDFEYINGEIDHVLHEYAISSFNNVFSQEFSPEDKDKLLCLLTSESMRENVIKSYRAPILCLNGIRYIV